MPGAAKAGTERLVKKPPSSELEDLVRNLPNVSLTKVAEQKGQGRLFEYERREEKNKTRFALAGAVIAAVTASLCCILPVIAAVLGVTGFAASEFFARWRPYLLAVTSGLLAVGFYLAYRRPRREACEVGSVCERTPIGRWNRPMLWLVTGLVIVLAAFPYYSGWAARAVTGSTQPRVLSTENSRARAVLQIDGMSCSACAALLEKRLSQIPGVRIIGTAPEKASVVSFVLDGVHPHDVGTVLDQEGIAVRTGHHCAQPLMERFKVPATARASLAFYNTKEEVDALAEAIEKVKRIFG